MINSQHHLEWSQTSKLDKTMDHCYLIIHHNLRLRGAYSLNETMLSKHHKILNFVFFAVLEQTEHKTFDMRIQLLMSVCVIKEGRGKKPKREPKE